jgi:hypothetical protein
MLISLRRPELWRLGECTLVSDKVRKSYKLQYAHERVYILYTAVSKDMLQQRNARSLARSTEKTIVIVIR